MKKITLFLFALFTCWQINAQVAYTHGWEPTGLGSWTTAGTGTFGRNTTTPCTGSASARANVYYDGTNTFTSPLLGTSNGGLITFGFDYKVTLYSSNITGAPAAQVQIDVQWSSSTTGPWNTLGTINNSNHVVSSSCASKSYTFVAPVGNVYVRFLSKAVGTSSDLYYYYDNISVSQGAAPSCFSPVSMTASSVTASSATITWSAVTPTPGVGYEYYYSNVNVAPTGAGTATTALTQNLSGLTSNTPYYVWLRSNCGSGDFSAWSGPFTFRTLCTPFSVPFSEGFNSTSTTKSCWTVLNVNADADAWNLNYATNPFEGDQVANMNTDINGGANDDWLISPTITLTGNQRLKFHYRVQSASEPNDFELLLSTTGTAPASFTNTLIANTSYSNITYVEQVVNLSAYSGDVNIAWHIPNGGLDGWRLYIDNVIIEDIPSCVEPNTIIASNVTSSTVDLSWTDGSGGLQFDYEYVIQAPGTGVPTASGAQVGDVTVIGEGFDINGDPLTSNTLYEVYVRANCDGLDFSPWVGPITFRTLCATFVAPFNEPFATNTFPSCWSQTGATSWEFGSNASTPAGFADYGADLAPDFNAAGGTFIGMDGSDNTDGEVSSLLTPFIDVTPLTTPRLKYAVFGNNVDDAARNLLQVEVWDGAAWNLVNTVSDNLGSSWAVFTTDLSTLTITGPIQIRFTVTGVANGGFTFYHDILIDDVTVEETPLSAPNCSTISAPVNAATDVAIETNISWSANVDATGYFLRIGTTPGGSEVLTNTDLGNVLTYNPPVDFNYSTVYYVTLTPYNANGTAVGCTETSFTTRNAPPAGSTCSNPIVINPLTLPYTTTDNTNLYGDDYENGSTQCSSFYMSGDDVVYTITPATNMSVDIVLSNLSATYSGIHVLDGCPNSTTPPACIAFAGNSGTTIRDIQDVLLTGGVTYYIVISTWAAPQSTAYTLTITQNTCVNPTVSFSAASNCPTTNFNAVANITNLGSATSLTVSDNQGSTPQVVTATGNVSFGPFAFGTNVVLTVVNDQDTSCSVTSSNLTTAACPPTNDDCATAIAISSMPYSNTQDASAATGPVVSTCTGMNDGVWYTVVGNGADIIIDVTAVTGWDPELGIYTGSCGTFTCVDSIDDEGTSVGETYTIVASTLGTTYYINVGHYSGFGDSPEGPFTIDVTTTLSSDSFDNANFTAYPNPVKDVLNVSYTSEISSIRVINMIGQEVISKNINATSTQVDMSQLSAGTYIVNVTVGDNVKTLKVVKQ